MSISCVIVSYNNLPFLKEAVESVLAQTHLPDEIIVSDDASSDGSQQYLKSASAEHDNIRLILRDQNLGVAKNRDLAIRDARCDLITTLDGDDFYYENKIEREVAALEVRRDGIAFSNIDLIDTHHAVHGTKDLAMFETAAPDDLFRMIVTRNNEQIPRDMLMSKRLYLASGGLDHDLSLYEDWDLKIRLAGTATPWRWSGCVGVGYRRLSSGLSHRDAQQHVAVMRRIIDARGELIESRLGKAELCRLRQRTVARPDGRSKFLTKAYRCLGALLDPKPDLIKPLYNANSPRSGRPEFMRI